MQDLQVSRLPKAFLIHSPSQQGLTPYTHKQGVHFLPVLKSEHAATAHWFYQECGFEQSAGKAGPQENDLHAL